MELFIARLFDVVFSEYGAFTAFLLIVVFTLWRDKSAAENRNNDLTDKLLDVVQGNTEAMTNLTAKIEQQKGVTDANNA